MKTEKALMIVSLVGFLFKFLHWPGGNILLILSLMTLALLYFPGAFYFFCDKVIKRQNLPLSIVSGFFLILIPVGILFKVMYWQGGQLYLSVGAVTAPIFLAVVYYLKSKANDDLMTYYNNMLLRTTVLTCLAVLFYFLPTSALLKVQYRDDPEMARLKTLYYTHPYNEEYKQQHDKYVLIQDSILHDKEKTSR